ncbi:uncharacterized protein M6B38_305355 [Iris pallida]|uniref:Late embryogenesis abundant protein LEA-2 subgroup domain-containing protein n=1 Tax=Iris pallida TaxID=29817 RepID=A0AAX6HM07_IRIPA|nr:uncharacterized protein M6B38_305355 [Iris pallida]
MTESSDFSVHHDRPKRRRSRCLVPCVACLLVVVALAVTAVVLALVLFKPRDPRTQLVSATVSGVSPRVSFPAISVDLNVTLDLDLLVTNPNRASFDHAPAKTVLYYRGAQVGDADVAPGRIPSHGSETMHARLTVEAGKLSSEAMSLLSDVIAGSVGFDASTRVPGRVTFLGFIKHHAVATSECHVEVGFPDLKVRSQQCTQKTKL